MTRLLLAMLFISAWLSGTVLAQSQEETQPTPVQPVDAAVTDSAEIRGADEIEGLVTQLGGDTFRERYLAQRALEKLGPAALPQLQAAVTSQDTEVAVRAQRLLEKFRELSRAQAEIYLVGCYNAKDGKTVVTLPKTEKPIILVVCAYDKVEWNIQAPKGTQLLEVVAAGYHQQTVTGSLDKTPIADAVQVRTFSYDEKSVGPDGQTFFFFAYGQDSRLQDAEQKVQWLVGKRPTQKQLAYQLPGEISLLDQRGE